MESVIRVLGFFVRLVDVLLLYTALIAVLGFFTTKRWGEAKRTHCYGVLIPARNEEKVIGNLIESIRLQDYPQEKLKIWVVADNCTDHTAETAAAAGAVVFERSDPEHRTKGFALAYLTERIRETDGIDACEGYFVFDADNLLRRDYVKRMNEAFDAGERIVTSYRNSKNFGSNWIAASYALHWLRTARVEHRGRSVLGLSARVQGTGFLFASDLIREGWKWTSITEDRAFSADAVAAGESIAYNDAAMFWDEQPEDLRIALRQRLRWARGHLESFFESGPRLLKGIFHGRAGRRLICYDMLWVVTPRGLFSLLRRLLVLVLSMAILGRGGSSVREILKPLGAWGTGLITGSIPLIGAAVYVLWTERKRIPAFSFAKRILFCLTFPLFDRIGSVCSFLALFRKVEWKPIPHTADRRAGEMEEHG